MANIVVYNPSDPDVANRVTAFDVSANTPEYNAELNKLVNPDLSSLWTFPNTFIVPQKYWKYDGASDIIEMSAGEKTTIDALDAPAARGVTDSLTVDACITDDTFQRLTSFIYGGTTVSGIPFKVSALVSTPNGAQGELRLVDRTHNTVIETIAITNAEEDEISITVRGDLNQWPSTQAVIEVQGKRTVGTVEEEHLCVSGIYINY